jgi:hypothetical protein
VPHQQRIGTLVVCRQEILHIHLLDLIRAVGIDLCRHSAGREHDLPHLLARDCDKTPTDMKRTHVSQRDRLGGASLADHQQRRYRGNGNA